MKREGTIGAATFLAIAAAVGFSVQTGPKPAESNRAEQKSTIRRSKPSAAKAVTHEHLPACTGLKEELEDFLEIGDLILPEQCYKRGDAPKILPDRN